MDIILLERIEKLGSIGDVVTVKDGYARNFLLPQKKALRANEANIESFEAKKAQLEADNLETKKEAEAVAAKLDGQTFIVIRSASDAGALYGSVSARDVADAVTEAGHKVLKSAVVLEKPIKTLGITTVKLVLHPEVTVSAKVNVARSPEEAELQAKGVDVTADLFEREEAGFTEEFDASAEPGTLPTDDAAEESTEA